MSSEFSPLKHIEQGESPEINREFNADRDPRKVNLFDGSLHGIEKSSYFTGISKLFQEIDIHWASIPPIGSDQYNSAAVNEFLLGPDSRSIAEGRCIGIQTTSGIGALSLGAEFLCKHLNRSTFYYSKPGPQEYKPIFENRGFQNSHTYSYDLHRTGKAIRLKQMIRDLSSAPEKSVILLQVCAHNPTGIDPNEVEWSYIADVMERRNLFPFFDARNQGLASGSPEIDAFPVRYFESRGFEFFVAQNFDHFGLGTETPGNLCIVHNSIARKELIESNVHELIRYLYGATPSLGFKLLHKILTTPNIKGDLWQWMQQVAESNKKKRDDVISNLQDLKTPGNWDLYKEQTGMFLNMNLTQKQIDYLRSEYHIYIKSTGKINLCHITDDNIDHIAKALHTALIALPKDELTAGDGRFVRKRK